MLTNHYVTQTRIKSCVEVAILLFVHCATNFYVKVTSFDKKMELEFYVSILDDEL